MNSLTDQVLGVAEAVMQGRAPDIGALASLLETTLRAAKLAMDRNIDVLLRRAVLRALVSRMLRVSVDAVDIADIDVAFLIVGVMEQAGTPMSPARGITVAELGILGAFMRHELVTYPDIAAVLDCSPVEVRSVMEPSCGTDVTDDVLIASLLLRLSGRRVALRELASALAAVHAHTFRQAVECGEIRP